MILNLDNYSFEYDEYKDGIKITKCQCQKGADTIIFPSKIDDKKVICIGDSCCDGEFWCLCSSIVVEEGIEEIENRAFSTCALLTKVTLPSTIKKIGNHLFDQSANLNEIEISSKNPYFSSYKECNCIVDLKTMTLIQAIGTTTVPEGVLVIASDAYYQLNEIKSITIPDSVVTLEKNCFNECSELNNLYIGKSVKDATDCFYNCFSLNDIKISDDNPYITYNINIRNFISKSVNKLTELPLDSYTFSIQFSDNNDGQYVSLKYVKSNNTLTFERDWKTTTIRCLDFFEEPLKEIAYLMGYVEENIKSNSNEYQRSGIYKINDNVRFSFSCNNYSADNITITDENCFIRIITILEFLAPFELDLVRNIPIVKYSIDDINYKYLTIPDAYYDMFDTYKKINNEKHPLDSDCVLVKSNAFASKNMLKYVKIRKCDYRFENNQFKDCENLKVIYLNGCQEIGEYIDASLNKTIALDPPSQDPIFDDNKSPF